MMYSLKIAVCALAVIALLGCISMNEKAPQTKEQIGDTLDLSPDVPTNGLISVSGDDNISVVTIHATNKSGKWRFPAQDYNDEFLFAGLHSDSFMMLNRSQISWLGDDEAIWLTIYRGNGSGVLFNAIYSKKITSCNASEAMVLGKRYPLSQLKNGSSFLNDDKWKVAIESENGCVKRAIIYLDGYFDGLKETDQIPLFRNDNTILLQFGNLASEPEANVIGTKPPQTEEASQAPTANKNSGAGLDDRCGSEGSAADPSTSIAIMVANETVNSEGAYVEFEKPLSIRSVYQPVNGTITILNYSDMKAPESFRAFNRTWSVGSLDSGERQIILPSGPVSDQRGFVPPEFTLFGGETETIHRSGCGADPTANSSGWYIFNMSAEWGNCATIRKNGTTMVQIRLCEGESSSMSRQGGSYVKMLQVKRGSCRCDDWALVSTSSDSGEDLKVYDTGNNVTLFWTNDKSGLKAFFIPRTSPIFEKMTPETDKEGDEGGRVEDFDTDDRYMLNQTIDTEGLHLGFDPPIKVIPHVYFDRGNLTYGEWRSYNQWDFLDSHHVYMDIGSRRWVVADFGKGPDVSKLTLAKDASTAILMIGESIFADGKELVFSNFESGYSPEGYLESTVILSYSEGGQSHNISVKLGTMTRFGNGYLKAWKIAPGYTFGASWVDISYLTDRIDLADPTNNATIEWVDPDSWENASLKSVFIPRSSPIFEKLTG